MANGGLSVGTGFFFAFCEEGNRYVPAVVTNRHVVEGATSARLRLTLTSADHRPDLGRVIDVDLQDFPRKWVPHPDPQVDLVAIPISDVVLRERQQGNNVYFKPILRNMIPSREDLAELSALEEIVMVGHPIGLWDSRHNMPLFRRGVAATHPELDYEGRTEFVIDAACFPGSSGSPVFYYYKGLGITGGPGMMITGGEPRLLFLGVLYAGPIHTVDGKIEVRNVPTQSVPLAVTPMPSHLGFVIKSTRVLEFDQVLQRMATSP